MASSLLGAGLLAGCQTDELEQLGGSDAGRAADLGSVDSGAEDSGAQGADATIADLGEDAGQLDAEPRDAEGFDLGEEDAGFMDMGSADAEPPVIVHYGVVPPEDAGLTRPDGSIISPDAEVDGGVEGPLYGLPAPEDAGPMDA